MAKGVLFVCLGNICRSPMAQAIFEDMLAKRGLTKEFFCDSAGVYASHEGEPCDPRVSQVLQSKDMNCTHRSRLFCPEDGEKFDYLFAMDHPTHASMLKTLGNSSAAPKEVVLMRQHDPRLTAEENKEVPDPYYGGANGFHEVYDILFRSIESFLGKVMPS